MRLYSVYVIFFVRYGCFQIGMHFLFYTNQLQVGVTFLLQKKKSVRFLRMCYVLRCYDWLFKNDCVISI